MINAHPRSAFLAHQNGRLEAAYTPDIADDIDDPDEIHRFNVRSNSQCSSAADILKSTLELLIDGESITSSTPKAIGNRVLVLLWGLQSTKAEICAYSFAQIAERTGESRALFSHYAKMYEDRFGIHFRGMKGQETTEVFKESATESWKERHARKDSKRSKDNYQAKLAQKLKLKAA